MCLKEVKRNEWTFKRVLHYSIIAKTKCTTFQNEMYIFLVFLHPTKKQFKRHLITVSTVIKCLSTTL